MKIKVKRIDFLKAFDKAKNSLTKANSYSYAATCIHMNAIGNPGTAGSLILSTTEVYTSTQCIIDCEIIQPGEILLAGKIGDLFRVIPDDDVTIALNTKDYSGTIKYSQGQTKIVGVNPATFPKSAPFVPLGSIKLTCNQFKKLVSSVIFACTVDSSAPVLSAVNFDIDLNSITVCALDRKRIAVCQLDDNFGIIGSVAIPKYILLNQLSMIEDFNSVITMEYDDRQVRFVNGSNMHSGQLFNATFPTYAPLFINNVFGTTVTIDKDTLLSCLRRIKAVCQVKSQFNSNFVNIKINSNSLEIIGRNDHIGEITETIPAQIKGDLLDINFDISYLLDGLEPITCSQVCWDLTGITGVSIIKAINNNDYQYIAMPVRM